MTNLTQTSTETSAKASPCSLVDSFQRAITYLRISVTDRCDFRCVYCMSEKMQFLPKDELLTLEELDQISSLFITYGVRKLRITGGEPLVRRNIRELFRSLSRHLDSGALDELTLTTNASQLADYAQDLYDCGVRRVNISLDTLDPIKFRDITRLGRFEQVMEGIDVAAAVGLKIKINTVALRAVNDDEFDHLIRWCGDRNFDLTFIEVMPMGALEGYRRSDQYLPLSEVRRNLERHWTLTPLTITSGGPARYVRVEETGGRLGFITPLTHNFCESCNRVRLTCTGRIYMCLGQQDAVDLRATIRNSSSSDQERQQALTRAIFEAIRLKPKGHDFVIERRQQSASVSRHMNVTGG